MQWIQQVLEVQQTHSSVLDPNTQKPLQLDWQQVLAQCILQSLGALSHRLHLWSALGHRLHSLHWPLCL